MGVDLSLMFPYNGNITGMVLLHSEIRLERRRGLWELINKGVKMHPIPSKEIYGNYAVGKDGECCYGKMEKNPYGSKLEMVYAGELEKVMSEYNKNDTYNPVNNAAAVFLRELPPDYPIVLYWY